MEEQKLSQVSVVKGFFIVVLALVVSTLVYNGVKNAWENRSLTGGV